MKLSSSPSENPLESPEAIFGKIKMRLETLWKDFNIMIIINADDKASVESFLTLLNEEFGKEGFVLCRDEISNNDLNSKKIVVIDMDYSKTGEWLNMARPILTSSRPGALTIFIQNENNSLPVYAKDLADFVSKTYWMG